MINRTIQNGTSSSHRRVDDVGEITVRQAENVMDMEAVYRLTHDCYVSQSYAPQQENGLLLHYPEFDVVPETTVFVAHHDDELVGSVSCTVAHTAELTVGRDFEKECLAMEREGRTLCAIWRLVIKDSHRTSRKVLFALVSEVTRHLLRSPMTSFLMEVHPKHAGIYQRLLNMRIVAEKGGAQGLHQAPATLLRGDRETLPEEWRLADFTISSGSPIGLLSLELFR